MNKPAGGAQFTPGPWRISGCQLGQKLLIEHGDEETLSPIIGSVYEDGGRLPQSANANLIAAAPAMYEALTNLLPEEDIVSTDNGPDECRWCGRTYPDNDNEGELQVLCTSDDCPGYMARQAIAQAEGRQG